MTLIKCSECGRQISDKAVACVECGNPIRPGPQECILEIRRPDAWAGKIRALKVFIDGTEKALLHNNETNRLKLSPGEHIIHMKMDWVKSDNLTINFDHSNYIKIEATIEAKGFFSTNWIISLRVI